MPLNNHQLKPVKKIQIAIDGPVAAGKGTVAHLVAQKLGLLYVDTGAMYRAVALLGLNNHLNLKQEDKLLKILQKGSLKLYPPKNQSRFCKVVLNGKDVTREIRDPQASQGSSIVATLPKIRQHLVKLQQQMAKEQSVIMEGRDITTVVLPNADLRIYMTASIEKRVRRRQKELSQKGIKKSYRQVFKETRSRDRRDSSREVTPLTLAKNVWLLRTSDLTIPQVVEKIIARLQKLELVKHYTSKVLQG